MKKFLGYIAAAATFSLLAACGSDDHPPEPPKPVSILATAQATPDLSSLVAAVQFASDNNDLVNLLGAAGTLTVFAPTNAAFDKLAVTLTGNTNAKAADILVPANKALVKAVLQYHVLTSKVNAAQIPFGKAITPAAGGIFKIDNVNSKPVITDGRNRKSNITATDIEASNGVVHLIDLVLLPANKDIVTTAIDSAPEFTSLVAALQFASDNGDLVTLLKSTGPFTVFAPTNAAFDALAKELTGNASAVATDILVPANKALIRSVLQYHVLAARVLKADILPNTAINTALAGKSFTIQASATAVTITDGRNRIANITATDVLTSNGVIHVIDKVILPAL
ncbi:MAG: fasciclin domain-containing protein [Betaproteobacteria bacterium]|nr:MAG: fasciclin domain-containing protein [Betaproteobacteria bacterium]